MPGLGTHHHNSTQPESIDLCFCYRFIGDYHYQESTVWTTEDIELYTESIMEYDKDFNSITSAVSSSSTPQPMPQRWLYAVLSHLY